jgi:RNA polymerase sigma factor (sigma-70 family)
MSDPSANTEQMHGWVERMRAGDLAAREELLRSLCGRLERLARKMLRGFPRVHRWADTADVLQNALLRLLRALEQVKPGSMRDFFGLVAEQMRRELLDLARHFNGPRGLGVNHGREPPNSDSSVGPNEPADHADDPDDLARWTRFHEAVEHLPAEEREVVGLVFYHGWTQVQVAELFGVTVRTVQRYWQAALVQLREGAGKGQGHEPDPEECSP